MKDKNAKYVVNNDCLYKSLSHQTQIYYVKVAQGDQLSSSGHPLYQGTTKHLIMKAKNTISGFLKKAAESFPDIRGGGRSAFA